jgi:hypothetical protein
MIKIAFVMGKQGSGKTTRVAHGIERRLWLLNLVHRCARRPGKIRVLPNYFNHMALDARRGLVFVTGAQHGKRTQSLADLEDGRYLLEFPHSGYVPPGSNEHLNTGRIRSRIFAIVMPEPAWMRIGGDVGEMTSPGYFLERGPKIVSRHDCKYLAETARIREEIARSRIPATYYATADAAIRPVRDFLLR